MGGGTRDPTLQASEGEAAEAGDRNGVGEHPNGSDDPTKRRGMLGPRPSLLRAFFAVLLAGVLAVGCGFGGGVDLTLGYLGWDENVANSNLVKVLLEDELGYESVELKSEATVPQVFKDVAGGDTDLFLDAWMPNHRVYVKRGGDRIELSEEPWFSGETRFGIAVPKYMKAVRSIADLDDSGTDMITGIEPGAVMMKKIEGSVLPGYRLDSRLVEATTPAMLEELQKAYGFREPFVFLAWSPHWMNQEYDFHYLEDPKNAMGTVDAPQRLHSVMRSGFAEDDPVAHALIVAMRLDEEQVGALEISINEAKDPEKGVREWLEREKNRKVVRPWVEAARDAQEG
ncbi:MAG: glycine betaine ABC transporter substrate-binding protein [Rubrobacter sp.]